MNGPQTAFRISDNFRSRAPKSDAPSPSAMTWASSRIHSAISVLSEMIRGSPWTVARTSDPRDERRRAVSVLPASNHDFDGEISLSEAWGTVENSTQVTVIADMKNTTASMRASCPSSAFLPDNHACLHHCNQSSIIKRIEWHACKSRGESLRHFASGRRRDCPRIRMNQGDCDPE